MGVKLDFSVTRQQAKFLSAQADLILFGGAAGGGKSHGQMIDAMVYALKYPGSKQLILRRTLPELRETLIPKAYELNYNQVGRYNISEKKWTFVNGSVLIFGYLDTVSHLYRYQSSEWDVIRLDEQTHFPFEWYTYLLSRLRGSTPYPRSMKGSTNPGNVGHAWNKELFVDSGPPEVVHEVQMGEETFTTVYIPATVTSNNFIDPKYIKRLNALSETDRKMLRDGSWDVYEGQYFTEWNTFLHVIDDGPIPPEWERFCAIDYGRDMFAALFFALDTYGRAICYKEIYEPGLLVSQAAERILLSGERVLATFAPRDLWNKHSDTGKSTAELFFERGVPLTLTSNERVAGWTNVAEWLHPYEDEQGQLTAQVRFMRKACPNIIRTLPLLQHDKHKPNDVADDPHELTHAPDALRYFIAGRPRLNPKPQAAPSVHFKALEPAPSPSGFGDDFFTI